MLYLFGIGIDFFLVFLLASKKNKSEADKILALWLFFIGLHLLLFYFFVTGQIFKVPFLMGVGIPFPLLHGPFLYLYTSSLTNQGTSGKLRLLHFLPFVMAYVPMVPFFISTAAEKIRIFENQGAGYEWLMNTLFVALVVSGISYLVLSLLKLRQHRRNIENQFSNTEKINLNWLRYLIFGMGVIWLMVILSTDPYIYATVVLYVFFMGYFGIRQTTIFSHHSPSSSPVQPVDVSSSEGTGKNNNDIHESEVTDSEKAKYLKSGLSEQEQMEIHDRLLRLMEQERLFVNPELTLGETAQQLDVHPNYLSQVINSVSKKNFYDFINSWRVEEFNKAVKLPENQKFTLLSLAYECGFNSKSSFNRNFRKITGFSPTEYLKEYNVTLSQ